MKLKLRKLYKTFEPLDKESFDIFNSLPMNAIFTAELVKPRQLNSDEITDEQRSVAQNRLMWGWLTDLERTAVNEVAGNTKDEWHNKLKRKFLIQIYERDSQQYAEMVSAVRQVYTQGMRGETEIMLNFIADKTSTTEGTVQQIAEYLTCIERYAHEKGVSLRTDTRLNDLARGF